MAKQTREAIAQESRELQARRKVLRKELDTLEARLVKLAEQYLKAPKSS